MKKILSLVIVLLLVLGSVAYGDVGLYIHMSEQISNIGNANFPEYEAETERLRNEYKALGIDYDILSGYIISENPFIISVDSNSKDGGLSVNYSYKPNTDFAQISYPIQENIKNGYYTGTHPVISKAYSQELGGYKTMYGASSDNVLKAKGIAAEVRIRENELTTLKYTSASYINLVDYASNFMYVGECDEMQQPNGMGAYGTAYDYGTKFTREGNFSYGKNNGFVTYGSDKYLQDNPSTPYKGIYYYDTLIEAVQSYQPTNLPEACTRFYVGTPGVYYSEFYEPGQVYFGDANNLKDDVISYNKTVYLPLRELMRVYNKTVDYNANTKSVIVNGNISISSGSNKIILNGQTITLSGNIEVINGVTYIPIDFMKLAFPNEFMYDIDSTSYIIPVVNIYQIFG